MVTAASKSRREADHARSLKNNGLDAALLNKAVGSLIKYHEKSSAGEGKKDQLLGTDKHVQVQIGLNKVPQRTSPKPIRVEIPHPLQKVVKIADAPDDYDDASDDDNLEEAEVCIIVKEESKPWVKDLIDKFPNELGCVKKVLGLQSLRNKHKRYEQRRVLLDRYDIFMCDDRILPMVGKAIGKNFFEAKKQPVPLKLTRNEALPFAVQRCLRATYMYISAGTCINIRAGNTGMPVKSLNENIQAIVASAVDKIPSKWAHVRSIAIKLPDSTSLPVYNKTPEELEEIARLAGSTKKVATEDDDVRKEESKKVQSEEKKRKKDLAAKSPLVRALKKQKLAKEAAETVADENPVAVKSGKKKKKSERNPADAAGDTGKADSAKSGKKKKRKKSDEDVDSPRKTKATSKESFIASKKFVGSKKGYAFYKGKKGLGYYIDNPPKVDKMAMAALARLANTPLKGGRGGRKGGRRVRR
mmetsp:Transcript_13479/g.28625  ORF Transcript_13479/g.28625 Transcript_13479/m.28625 type:complete len:472 (-) Transcript_13479:71-1486(-)